MATITIPIDDLKLLEYVKEHFGLVPGESSPDIGVNIEALPAASNSTVSHNVEVTLRYGLTLGEVNKIAGF